MPQGGFAAIRAFFESRFDLLRILNNDASRDGSWGVVEKLASKTQPHAAAQVHIEHAEHIQHSESEQDQAQRDVWHGTSCGLKFRAHRIRRDKKDSSKPLQRCHFDPAAVPPEASKSQRPCACR